MFKSLSPRARQKRFQRIVIGILVAVLSMGLIGSSMVWSGLGSAQNDTKAPSTIEERIKLLEEQAKEKPNDTGLLLNLASHYIQVGKITQADDLYAKVIQLEPKNISVRQNLALSYYSQGKIDLAEKQLTEALAIEANNADLNFQYAKLLAEKKDYQGAITAMEKVLAVQKEGPKAEEARKSIEQWKIQAGQ